MILSRSSSKFWVEYVQFVHGPVDKIALTGAREGGTELEQATCGELRERVSQVIGKSNEERRDQ